MSSRCAPFKTITQMAVSLPSSLGMMCVEERPSKVRLLSTCSCKSMSKLCFLYHNEFCYMKKYNSILPNKYICITFLKRWGNTVHPNLAVRLAIRILLLFFFSCSMFLSSEPMLEFLREVLAGTHSSLAHAHLPSLCSGSSFREVSYGATYLFPLAPQLLPANLAPSWGTLKSVLLEQKISPGWLSNIFSSVEDICWQSPTAYPFGNPLLQATFCFTSSLT